MSLLNILSTNITGTVLGNSRALSSITSTTFGQAGTSLSAISTSCLKSSVTAMNAVGGNDANFYAPITAMQNYATSVDPNNSSFYASAAQASIAKGNAAAASALPNYNNTLFDTQNAGREAISTSVNNYGSAINVINPAVGTGATNIGLNGLGAAGNLSDTSCTAAYGSVNNTLTANINNINTTIADKAQAGTLGSGFTGVPLPSTPPAVSPAPTVTYTSSGVDEGAGAGKEVNTTDVIYQEVKVYIEGVQVPFESISINQSLGQLPRAAIQIPPQAGLMDIARYYQPKVHIFFKDNNIGGDRLLFWGHIIAVNYARSQQSSMATISFECAHKNALLHQVTFEWSGGGASNPLSGSIITNTNVDQASVQVNTPSSEYTIMRSLQGITGVQTNAADLIAITNKDVLKADPTLLPARFAEFEKRLIGMPASILNIWNQVKIGVYADEKLNIIFGKMFVPLLEDGIKFFDRLSGHYYLENQIQNDKVDHCNDTPRPELSKYRTMLPPSFRMDIQSAVQTQLAVSTLKSSLNFSGEFTSFYDLFEGFYRGVDYELVTLACPGEIPADPTVIIDPDNPASWINTPKSAVETIVKPQIPFYFSPVCNVLLPNMYHSINVTQHEDEVPTRITAVGTSASQMLDNPGQLGVSYRAPESIRETIAIGRQLLEGVGSTQTYALVDTTGSSYNLPGKYELGRGIKHMKVGLPNWLSHFVKDQDGNRASTEDQVYPVQGSLEYQNILNLHSAWIAKYGYNNTVAQDGTLTRTRNAALDVLDPYSTSSNIMSFERLLFSTADYEFTREVAKSRDGTVDCLFNPYIVPGYPMDIMDASPNHPSFHAMCAGVTHSITSRSISTTVSFLAASTYTEMSNYYMQPIHPWLRSALSIVNVARSEALTADGSTATSNAEVGTSTVKPIPPDPNSTVTTTPLSPSYGLTADPTYDTNTGDVTDVSEGLINNPRAKAVADLFYRGVFGVGSVAPEQIYDFTLGGNKPVSRRNGLWVAGSTTPNISAVNGGEINDNLTGVGGLKLVSRPIEGKKSIEAKFGIKFIDMTPQNYNSASVVYQNSNTFANSQLLEPGASMFLDYPEVSTIMDITPIESPSINRPNRGGA